MNLDIFLKQQLEINPKVRLPDSSCITTAATSNFFPGVQLLYCSLFHTHENFTFRVFDLGFTELQRKWCENQPNLVLVPFEPEKLMIKPDKANWPQYNRPFYLFRSKYRWNVWMDCDCIVKASIYPLFHHIERQPFIVENPACTPNDRKLYDAIYCVGTREDFRIASGVFGWDAERDLDKEIISTWMFLTEYIINDKPELEQYIRTWDESILRVVIQKLNLYHLIWPDQHWNRVVYERYSDVVSALQNAKIRFPDEYILHFYGRPKIWETNQIEAYNVNPSNTTD